MFTGRFIVQWLSSERNKRVTIPRAFWFLSIGGSTMLLSYAIHQRDIVFILGQSTGLFIYLRNLQISLKETTEKPDLSAEKNSEHADEQSQSGPVLKQKAA